MIQYLPQYMKNLFHSRPRSGRPVVKFEPAAFILLAAISLFLWLQFARERQTNLAFALATFQATMRGESHRIAGNIESSFRQIYQGVRTIARLPGVKSNSPDTHRISGEARSSAQEIYNNLAQNVAISELYIVPANFDPDKVDPATGALQTPIATFDELIVGRNADQAKSATLPENLPAEPEIEIYEYQEMKRQIAWFKVHAPTENAASPLAYPAVISGELITCDNTHFSPATPSNKDRTGIIYSVPFYHNDRTLAGIISAVILTDVLGRHIPNGTHALKNDNLGILVGSNKDRSLSLPVSPPGEDSADSQYALWQELPLKVPGVSNDWKLWSASPRQIFDTSAPVQAINGWYLAHVVSLISCMGALSVVLRRQSLRHRIMALRNQDLESAISERTTALARSKWDAEQANSAKSYFLASVSHEIRTPMHAIMSAADLLASTNPKPLAAQKIAIIRGASRSLLDLVNQVLEMSAIEQRKLELTFTAFSPATLVQDTCAMLAESARLKGVNLQVEGNATLPALIVADACRIRQIIINLVGNAIKFTNSGSITVEAGTVEASPAGLPQLSIWVCDTGPGIPAELRPTLFQPFGAIGHSPAGPHRIGLGLAISKQLVELMGGALELDESYGSGAAFQVLVPYGTHAPGMVAEHATGEPAGCQRISAKVLLAEDHSDLQILTRELLEKLGCDVSIAANGNEAVAMSAEEHFDVILMDSLMPELGGLEATRIIRAREAAKGNKPIPIISLTADIFESKASCHNAGATDFLAKPFSLESLHMILRRNLEMGRCDTLPATGLRNEAPETIVTPI